MSKIAIVGYGNVGYHIANRLSGRNEVFIFSRNPPNESIQPFSSFISDNFEFIFLTVPDTAIQEVAESFDTKESIVIHTSGSRPLTDLQRHSKHGVIYPLQTFSRNKKIDFDTFPIFVEGNEGGEMKVFSLASSIGNDVRLITSANRIKLHLAAVFACNFSNHLFQIAENLLEPIDVSFEDIKPLIEETVEKAFKLGPSHAQTGPAVRRDEGTIQTHLKMLKDEDLNKMYQLISKNIQLYL